MHYFSTNKRSPTVTFREAVLNGQPDDRGLYYPSEIPRLSDAFFDELPRRPIADIAFDVMRPYVAGEVADERLFEICRETVSFPLPVVRVSDTISTLELFHGPTLAFKDVGARFMSRCLQEFSLDGDKRTLVIVATSGDTGGAVADGFHGVEGVDVAILFPKGKVSGVQEMQLTRVGGNVITLEVHGTFDDCLAIAKKALADDDIKAKAEVTSANSINVARWLPQQIYYFAAMQQIDGSEVVVSVPSGNFGNLAAGLLAAKSGLPIKRFIAACNANDVVPRFLLSHEYEPRPSIQTLSNAMDVGDPSNFVRILEMFNRDTRAIRSTLSAVSISDAVTETTMREVYEQCKYILDPHGAVAYRALTDDLNDNETGVFLETAHPIKFDSVSQILDKEIPVPDDIAELARRPRTSIEAENSFDAVKEIILSKI